MAEDKKDKKTNTSGGLDLLKRLRGLTTSSIYGSDQNFYDENDNDVSEIKQTIVKLRQYYKQTTGDDIIEFFNRVNFETNKEQNTINRKSDKNKKENQVDFNKLIDDPQNLAKITDILYLEADRIGMYNNYKMIYDHIPQMAQALDTYVDNILSPDDFTKDIFNLFYDGRSIKNIQETDENFNQVIKNLKTINTRYNIEKKASVIIRDTLVKGDQFVAVLKLEKQLNNLLTENTASKLFSLDNSDYGVTFMTKDNIEIEKEELNLIKESKILESNEDKDILEWIANSINENLQFENDYNSLLEDNFQFQDDIKKEAQKKNKKSQDIKINGSVVKLLEPERVIKLSLDDVVYGYYYVEKITEETLGQQINSLKQHPIGLGMQQGTVYSTGKIDMITDIFVRNIAKKIDKKFVTKNKDFKNLIYNLLKQGYVVDKKVRITYLSPDEVIHFKTNENEYGDSVYKKVFFIAKLYLAVLTSTLMSKLIRSSEKRVFYIEVGLDNDAENAVQSFVRDIKNKEIKMADLKDINTVLNNPGQFNDYYIPVINGEKPVEIDTLAGMDVEINNDFLEYLLKTMISGIGVPSTFLNYADEVEFMKSLAMQNGKFVRAIIHYQKMFGHYFSELYRKIYKNEFIYREEDSAVKTENAKENKNVKNEKENGESELVSYEKIQVKFPSPSSLNMTNMIEQINNSKDIIDYIVTTLIGENSDEGVKKYAVKAIATDMIPSIDWERYEKLISKSIIEKNRDDLLKLGADSGDASAGGDTSDAGY